MDAESAAKLALLLALAGNGLKKQADVRLEGTVGYTIQPDSNTIELRVERIAHDCDYTGKLRIVLWACTECNADGTSWSGKAVAAKELNGLRRGQAYGNIKLTVPFGSPAPGTYTPLMVIQTLQNGEYKNEHSMKFQKPMVIGQNPLGALLLLHLLAN